MKIVKLTEDFCLVYKDCGVPVESQDSTQMNVSSWLSRELLNHNFFFQGLYLVNRIDQVTEGIVLFAFKQEIASKLSQLLQDKTLTIKEYLVICSGTLPESKGILQDYLFHDAKRNKSFIVDRARNGAKIAELSYELIASSLDFSLYRVRLFTGRTHQIRIQFAHRKCPIVGDSKYGSRVHCTGIALCSYHLSIKDASLNDHFDIKSYPDFSKKPWSEFQGYESII